MGDYTVYRGLKACVCVAAWFPVFEKLAQQRGLVSGPIWLIQATGSAAASAGTHSQGGAMDVGPTSHALVRLAREMGASASWVRNTGSFATNQHSHLVLEGCPHNAPARYQITAVKQGRDGLGAGGMAGPDPEWRPPVWRTWTQGLQWADKELDMQLTDRFTRPDGKVSTVGQFFAWKDQELEDQGERIARLEAAVNRLVAVVCDNGIAVVGRPGQTTDLSKEAAWNPSNVAAGIAATRQVPGIDKAAVDQIAEGVAARIIPTITITPGA